MSHFFWSCKALFAMEKIDVNLIVANVNMIKRRLVLTGALVCASLASLGIGLYTTYKLTLTREARFESVKWEVFSCLISTCVIDFSISTILIMLLAKQPKGTSWTDSTAVVLASYALNTGFLNSIISTASIIAVRPFGFARYEVVIEASVQYAIDQRSYAFLGIRVILSTVHINSLMAMLNARHYFQKETPATVILQSHDARLTVSQGGNSVYASRRRPTTADKERTPTINEAGLPQFDKTPALIGNQAGIVEVVIQREQSTTISRALRV
ncbi:hypothetical protein EYR36_005011 [Pleurotus pulmonarius]|nr:hypothetical protein EYR36_005011 [Pleurotus pulmonarius]